MNNQGWQGTFDDPILLPDGRKLITLHDAATVITKLPKPEHDAPEWQAAIEALMLVVDLGGPTIFARVGVVRALSRHQKPFVKPRKKRVRAYTNRQMMKRPWIVKHQPRPQALVLRGARRLTLAFSGRQDAGTVGADPVGRWHYLFARLAEHLSVLASEVERAIGKPAAQGRKSHTGDDLRRLPLHLRKSNLERLLARRPRSAPRATRQERASA